MERIGQLAFYSRANNRANKKWSAIARYVLGRIIPEWIVKLSDGISEATRCGSVFY